MRRLERPIIALALVLSVCIGSLAVLFSSGLLVPFSVPTGAMRPAVSAGDRVFMEGLTFLCREPRRGDVVVFKSDGIDSLRPATMYVERVAGEPGDHVRLSGGKLFVNDQQVSLSNALGEIVYKPPPRFEMSSLLTDVTVPSGCYFVLGDNSTNSADSRFWGCVPRTNIVGRVSICYWPPQRVGGVK